MLDKARMLNEIYEHLHNYMGIHTKGEFADRIGYARAYISSFMLRGLKPRCQETRTSLAQDCQPCQSLAMRSLMRFLLVSPL